MIARALMERVYSLVVTMGLPRYRPVVISIQKNEISEVLHEALNEGIAHGYQTVVELNQISKPKYHVENGFKVKKRNLQRALAMFNREAGHADPDSLAVELIDRFCVGFKIEDIDTKRRLVAAWSAILAPRVVLREFAAEKITLEGIIDDALCWAELGYTSAAEICSKNRKTRFIARHPASFYELLMDVADRHSVEHKELLISHLLPVIKGIGSHFGAYQAVSGNSLAAWDIKEGGYR